MNSIYENYLKTTIVITTIVIGVGTTVYAISALSESATNNILPESPYASFPEIKDSGSTTTGEVSPVKNSSPTMTNSSSKTSWYFPSIIEKIR